MSRNEKVRITEAQETTHLLYIVIEEKDLISLQPSLAADDFVLGLPRLNIAGSELQVVQR